MCFSRPQFQIVHVRLERRARRPEQRPTRLALARRTRALKASREGAVARQAGRRDDEAARKGAAVNSQRGVDAPWLFEARGPTSGRPKPAHATAVCEVKERHPSERQVCEIRPGLYPPRSIFCAAVAV